MEIKFSRCQTFLEVDDMKFMTVDEIDTCVDCHFNAGINYYCNLPLRFDERKCAVRDRKDKRDIIWMRIL